jgi:hypothetical protein
MTGNNSGNRRKAMLIVQERDRKLLFEIGTVMRIVDRAQARIVAGFGSDSRTNRRLRKLTDAKLLQRYYFGAAGAGRKALYGLSRQGAIVADVPFRGLQRRQDEPIVTDFFVQHQLAVNEIYCRIKYRAIPQPHVSFKRWISFSQPIVQGLRLIPDGYFELATPAGTLAAFLEVDRGSETLATWKEKVRNYLSLAISGEFERRFGEKRFRVFVIANSVRRIDSIRSAVMSLTEKIFWFSTLGSIEESGFFAPVWVRPKGKGEERQPPL